MAQEPLFQRKYRLPIFLAVSIGMFNQLSGINAILYYLNDIFAQGRVQQGFGRPAVGGDRRDEPAVHDARDVHHRPRGPQEASD